MYTILENARIVIDLLKKHNIHHIVLNPGGSNIPIVQGVQDDPFFKCYSVVDERSALYFAIGIYLQTGEIVAVSCTSAQATRNYIPGLTEAYYKHVPILAITMSKHPMYLSQEYMQCPIQTSLPIDAVKKSYSLPRINDNNDRDLCIRMTNEAILELTHHGLGPVQLNIEELDSETWKFDNSVSLPNVRQIVRYTKYDSWPKLDNKKKVMILVGEHRPFSESEKTVIEKFCESHNVFVYSDSIGNYHGKYTLQANLIVTSMSDNLFASDYIPEILITIGGLTGDYGIYNKLFKASNDEIEHWRISEDGNVVDTYKKLTKIFECSTSNFFEYYSNAQVVEHTYFNKWNALQNLANYDIELPFSNVYAAQQLHNKLPNNSYINFAILNSLRSWLYFPIDSSIKAFSNVAAFGIDGCTSMLLGESINTSEQCFLVTGDLAFFYDLNSIGIREIKNNVHILLVNNNGGVEFKLGDLQQKTEVSKYIAADGHFKNAKGWAETCGFEYYSASNKEEFILHINDFLSEKSKPVVFEIFTNPEDERMANQVIVSANQKGTVNDNIKKQIKKGIKDILGENNTQKLKKMLKK